MKLSSKIWKITWVSGIYIILLLILYLVVTYKVEWEHKDLNTYLYIYDCNHNLCSSATLQKQYYSKVLCEKDVCPYISDIIDDTLILNYDNKSFIYNYENGNVVNNKYVSYRHSGNNKFIVMDDTDNYGVINLKGDVLVPTRYEYIDDYIDGFISYRKNNLYGIESLDEKYKVDAKYEDVVLINNKIFAGRKDNLYHLYSYDALDNENANKYNYVESFNNVIFVVNNKKIDILNANLDSTLLMKINTFYEYTTEKERESLNLYSDGSYIYFDVFTSESEYISYKYDIKNKKLYN